MTIPNSIGKRIVRAYLLFSLGCTVLFAIAAAVVVEGIEVKLVDERLMEVAAWATPRHIGKLSVEMPAGLSFHHGGDIPISLRNLPEGIHEIDVDGVGLHVYASQNSAGPYVVIDHESDYVKVELAVYSMLGLGFLGFIGMSVFLGRYVASSVVTPIVALSTAVSERQQDLPLQGSDDELGILARAFAGHTSELQQFLDRERFFTGDVSHELRTPLTVISGAAEILMMEGRGNPAIHAPAERIYRAARDATDSVTILLLLARSPELIEAEIIQAADVVRDEVARYQALVVDKPVSLEFAGGTDFAVRAPRRLVAAVVGNLIKNGCAYTPAGTVSVSLENHAVIVSDTGKGLPDAVQAMLKGDDGPTELRGSEGTGLGLALVKRICRYLDATLEVSSGARHGTVFRIEFKPV
ncbi:sensor histidine kinase [Massilia cavernae]|uniref:histidine kinase n=1 Tax=Massilia cavernae TaxID=2320864 RepID=A0A418X7I7_9BURK|nr:HAMP domain-containing sensor histidine kinase [Massilia cavernae]RJG08464.1 sensor histidine kinase [Massilia cavernae]